MKSSSDKGKIRNDRLELFLKDFLSSLTEASYQVALTCGFRGSFIHFLSDLQEALEKVIQKDNSKNLKSLKGILARSHRSSPHHERRRGHGHLHS